jgi:2-polyprenyl-3-methyl-5-hydroxy-6-metoxy-1,4-benzoquinol methylase
MEIQIAIRLIEKGVEKTTTPQVWADLGAGKGLFSNALASLLNDGSVLYAIDKDMSALEELSFTSPSVILKKVKSDFITDPLELEPLDGILMANALHYVADPQTFIKNLKKKIKPSGRLIIVEYDRQTANQWIPYPAGFNTLELLASKAGFKSITKIGETPSLFNQSNIYAAVIL